MSSGSQPEPGLPPTGVLAGLHLGGRHRRAATEQVPITSGVHRAAQYVRMSTEHQRYSTENQADAIRQYAERRGLEIVRTYADQGKSGLRLDGRDALKQLIFDVENGRAEFSTILVYDVSRWGRFQDADESAYYEYICTVAAAEPAQTSVEGHEPLTRTATENDPVEANEPAMPEPIEDASQADSAAPATIEPTGAAPAEDAQPAKAPRTNTKQAQLIEMLRRPEGASIAEVVAAMQWQAHTVRGAIAGALKKKLGLKVESEKVDAERGRVYRITE